MPRFASRVFLAAGIFGMIALPPLYFLEDRLGRENPPPLTHPEFFYGFIGVAIAWQLVFLVIGGDPTRYRPLMLPSVCEKLGWGIAVVALFVAGRIPARVVPLGLVDLVFAVLFVLSYVRTPRAR